MSMEMAGRSVCGNVKNQRRREIGVLSTVRCAVVVERGDELDILR